MGKERVMVVRRNVIRQYVKAMFPEDSDDTHERIVNLLWELRTPARPDIIPGGKDVVLVVP